MANFVFWLIVGLTIGSAILVVQSKKLVYSAYALLFTLLGVTGLYVFLWADFLAVVQVVVYVGNSYINYIWVFYRCFIWSDKFIFLRFK